MPSLVKIRVIEGRDFPVMDRNIQGEGFSDSFVEIWLGKQELQRTQTIKKTLNPVWDEEFRFEIVDDSFLQNTPVEFKVLDQNLSSSEIIGVVYVDLNPLIMRTAHGSDKDLTIEGWYPLYDTLRGIQGSLHVMIKLQFIDNDNPFRDSSAGVQFFSTSSLSSSEFILQEVLGLVVDLVVEDDPEMSWHDYFRGAKSSNDSRMRVLYRLSATVRKEVGKKVIEAGGNAVLGYMSHFDVEGDSGIVARAYGTACRILKVQHHEIFERVSPPVGAEEVDQKRPSGSGHILSANINHSTHLYQNVHGSLAPSDEHGAPYDLVSFGPSIDKGINQIREQPTTSRYGARLSTAEYPTTGIPTENVSKINLYQDVELLSLKSFDVHVRIRFGGLVMAKSVKFLGKLQSSLSDQETREGWWEELRAEIRNHASILCCSHVVGYTETCTVHGDVCVLICTGTAAVVKGFAHPYLHLSHNQSNIDSHPSTGDIYTLNWNFDEEMESKKVEKIQSFSRLGFEASSPLPSVLPLVSGQSSGALSNQRRKSAPEFFASSTFKQTRPKCLPRPCSIAHVPYNRSRAPFAFMRLVPCLMCGSKWVPEYVVTTVQPSENFPIRGKGRLLEVIVHRARKSVSGSGDQEAVKMSEILPFVEFDLQKQLMLKLKVFGMNAAMGYTSTLQFSANMIIATATCTAVYLEPLPPPPLLQLSRNIKELKLEGDSHLCRIQERIEKICSKNRQLLEIAANRASRSQHQLRRQSTGHQSLRSRSLSGVGGGGSSESEESSSSTSSSSASSSDDDDDDSYTSSLESPSSSSSSSDESSKEEDAIQSHTKSPVVRSKRNSISPQPSDDGSLAIGTSQTRTLLDAQRRKKHLKKKLYEDDRKPFVIEVDDETDLDLMCVLADRCLPDNIQFVNTQVVPGSELKSLNVSPSIKEIKVVKRVKMPPKPVASGLRGGINHILTEFFQTTYSRLCFNLRSSSHYEIIGLWHNVTLMEDDIVELLVIAMVHFISPRQLLSTLSFANNLNFPINSTFSNCPEGSIPIIPLQSYAFGFQVTKAPPPPPPAIDRQTLQPLSSLNSPSQATFSYNLDSANENLSTLSFQHSASDWSLPSFILLSQSFEPGEQHTRPERLPSLLSRSASHRPSWQPIVLEGSKVTLSTLCYVPGKRIVRYLGPLQLHFIKESWTVRGEDLLGTFISRFISEVDAAARAQVAALGGNALLCHRIVPVESGSGVSRNQAYNMVSVYGDVVLVESVQNIPSLMGDGQNYVENIQVSLSPMTK